MSRRRRKPHPSVPGAKVIRIVCTDRGQHSEVLFSRVDVWPDDSVPGGWFVELPPADDDDYLDLDVDLRDGIQSEHPALDVSIGIGRSRACQVPHVNRPATRRGRRADQTGLLLAGVKAIRAYRRNIPPIAFCASSIAFFWAFHCRSARSVIAFRWAFHCCSI